MEAGIGRSLWSLDGTELLFVHVDAGQSDPDKAPRRIPGLYAITVDGGPEIRRVSDFGTVRHPGAGLVGPTASVSPS